MIVVPRQAWITTCKQKGQRIPSWPYERFCSGHPPRPNERALSSHELGAHQVHIVAILKGAFQLRDVGVASQMVQYLHLPLHVLYILLSPVPEDRASPSVDWPPVTCALPLERLWGYTLQMWSSGRSLTVQHRQASMQETPRQQLRRRGLTAACA